MPIPSPILDNRSYQQLRDELVRRIPVYAPEWTDHNPSDPGITLIELFAFLGENLLFRFNQIPESSKLAYLRLLRIPLLAAAPARALVAMTSTEAAGALVEAGAEVRAGALPFETLTEVRVWPVSIVAAAKIAAPAPDPATEPEAAEFALRAIDALGDLQPGEAPAYYTTQTVPVDDTAPPLDASLAVDGMLWVALLSEKGAVKAELAAGLLNLGFVPDATAPPIEEINGCPGAGSAASQGPAVEWQISTGQTDSSGQPLYRALTVEGDTTRGLAAEGVVRLRLPAQDADFGFTPETDEDLAGAGGRPPALDDEAAAKLICWLRVFRHDGSRFGKVRLVAVNVADVRHSRKALPEFVGTGDAQPNQSFRLAQRPIVERTVILEVEENGTWRRWSETDSFHASLPDDPHFIVDREAGEVRFGNGLQGQAPQIGRRIRTVEYRYGGGLAGNVAPKAISKFAGRAAVKTVTNPLAAHGGADSETVEAALERIPGELRRRDRAVTAGDFQELALQTPGAGIGRAECLPRFHAPTKTPERPGVVSVVVWPREDRVNPNAPRPDRNALRLVCEWLDQRRLVTTELYVVPPTYRKIAVAVGLRVKPGYGIEAVRRWVELVLRQYTAPLPPFGPDGRGWPLGRRVHGPELEAAALQVEGVEFLEDLQVAGFDEATQTWVPGSVSLALYEVPEMAQLTVVEGPITQPPGTAIVPPAGPVPVPIPVVRQVC